MRVVAQSGVSKALKDFRGEAVSGLQDQLMIALLCTGSLCWQVSAICGFRLNLHITGRAARDAEVTRSVELRTHYSSRNRTHRQLAHAGYYALK